jgi:hypothetical protein
MEPRERSSVNCLLPGGRRSSDTGGPDNLMGESTGDLLPPFPPLVVAGVLSASGQRIPPREPGQHAVPSHTNSLFPVAEPPAVPGPRAVVLSPLSRWYEAAPSLHARRVTRSRAMRNKKAVPQARKESGYGSPPSPPASPRSASAASRLDPLGRRWSRLAPISSPPEKQLPTERAQRRAASETHRPSRSANGSKPPAAARPNRLSIAASCSPMDDAWRKSGTRREGAIIFFIFPGRLFVPHSSRGPTLSYTLADPEQWTQPKACLQPPV